VGYLRQKDCEQLQAVVQSMPTTSPAFFAFLNCKPTLALTVRSACCTLTQPAQPKSPPVSPPHPPTHTHTHL